MENCCGCKEDCFNCGSVLVSFSFSFVFFIFLHFLNFLPCFELTWAIFYIFLCLQFLGFPI